MNIKTLAVAAAFSCSLATGTASAIVVGGVNFGPEGWHVDTTTLAETLITGDGQTLKGYGQVNSINGNVLYGANPNHRLYFVFDNYVSQNFTGTSVEFSGGTVEIYLGNTFNLLNQDSVANIALIQAMTPWLKLKGHGDLGGGASSNATLTATGTLTGASISFTGSGLLDVDPGWGQAAVENYLDANGEADAAGGFADITITTSGNSSVANPYDPACTQTPGQWGCIEGSADLRGKTVPEPSALALLGIGLLGMGIASRRRKASKAA